MRLCFIFSGALKTRARIRRLLGRFYPNLRVYLNREQPLCLAFRLRGGVLPWLTRPVVCKFCALAASKAHFAVNLAQITHR